MARNRFVAPEVVRLQLSDGDWLDVKKELNAGDTQRIFTDLVKDMKAGEAATLDPAKVGKTKILTYVVEWSLIDAQGKRVIFSASALDAVDPATYKEIHQAIEDHDAQVDEAREERKKDHGIARESSTISPSVN